MAIADTISSMYENVGEVYDTITNVDVNTGKNLISSIDIFNGYPTGNNGGTIGYNTSVNSITYKKCAYVEANKTYTLSWKINVVKAVGSRDIKIVDDNDIILENFAYSNGNNNRTRTFTPTHNGWVYASLDTNATEVQLELGSSATEYQPYTDNPTYKNIENIPSTIRKSYLDIMNNGIDTIYDNWEKVNGTGTSITLNNTEEAPMKINLKGNTSQESTTGKNLFNVNTTHSNSLSDAGITATFNSDGTITVNGTKNANYKTISYFITLPAGTYYFSGCPSGGSSGGYSIIVQTTNEISSQIFDTGNGATFTLTEQKKISFFPVRVGADAVTFNNAVFKPMIARVPVTYNDYEPYTNGASPNPDYPQDIHVVSGDNSINVCGKNLLGFKNGTYTNNQGIIAIVDNGKITLSGTGTANPSGVTIPLTNSITIPSNTTYTLSAFNNSTNSNVSLRLQAVESSNPYTNVTLSNINANATLQANEQYKVDRLYIRCSRGTTLSNFIIQPQIEKGSSASPYEPYQGNTYNIDLPVENLWGGFSNSFSRTDLGVQFTANQDGTITANGTATNVATSILLAEATANGIYKSLPKGTYIVSGGGTNYTIEVYDKDNVVRLAGIAPNSSSASFTLSDTTNVVLRVQVASGVTINETIKLQLETGDKANSYTPYGTTPIELCKIGNYQDSIVKDNGKWYLNKQIGKVVLNGSTNRFTQIFSTNTSGINRYRTNEIPIKLQTSGQIANVYCDKLIPKTIVNTYSRIQGISVSDAIAMFIIYIDDIGTYTLEQANNWLSTNNLKIYYVLANPTYTEITDSTLLSQLEAVKRSFNGQTNITQTNNDKPFILDVTALKQLIQ